jgi:hypothetical protein
MVKSRYNLALAIVAVFIVAVIPAFFVTSSPVDYLGFVILVFVVSSTPEQMKTILRVVGGYLDPLKIVDGRYGMSGAWIGAAPIGFIIVGGFSAVSSILLNNYKLVLYNV